MVLDRCAKAKPDLVLLPLPLADGKSLILKDKSMIDEFMTDNYLSNSCHFKPGRTERVVYERVNGMRKVNSIVSSLYNFSNEGPFPETAVCLYGPSALDCIEHF